MSEKFQPPKGTRDILPEEMKKLQKAVDVIRKVFEKYGFQPLETPAFEDFGLLSAKGGAGEAIKDEIYYFKDKSERELGLRFDLTVPLARVLANNIELPKPFKRYQIGKVWRYDNPQAMRWREFWQADVDTVGSSSTLSDVECVACFIECLQKLGFKDFYVRINNRKLIESILFHVKIPKDKVVDVFRILDKLDKIGFEGVKKELNALGVNSDRILGIIKMPGSNKEILDNIEREFGMGEGTNELKEFLDFAKNFGIERYLKLDLSLVRGLEYYTGPIFEVSIGKAKVSCGGGGRYDNLIKMLGGPDLPATGISFGLDRLITTMEELKISKDDPEKRFFVAMINDNVKSDAIRICQDLRNRGMVCDMDLMERNISKQLDYANSMGFPYVIIIGEEEIEKKQVKIKNMKTGKENIVQTRELFNYISKMR